MVFLICAQTKHVLSAHEVSDWLLNSNMRIAVTAVCVYNYMIESTPGSEPINGFWWVARLEHQPQFGLAKVRIYENTRKRHFTVKRLLTWPSLSKFTLDTENGGPLLYDGFKVDLIPCPFTYDDTYEEIRGKEVAKKITASKEEQLPYIDDLVELDHLKATLEGALETLAKLRAKIV